MGQELELNKYSAVVDSKVKETTANKLSKYTPTVSNNINPYTQTYQKPQGTQSSSFSANVNPYNQQATTQELKPLPSVDIKPTVELIKSVPDNVSYLKDTLLQSQKELSRTLENTLNLSAFTYATNRNQEVPMTMEQAGYQPTGNFVPLDEPTLTKTKADIETKFGSYDAMNDNAKKAYENVVGNLISQKTYGKSFVDQKSALNELYGSYDNMPEFVKNKYDIIDDQDTTWKNRIETARQNLLDMQNKNVAELTALQTKYEDKNIIQGTKWAGDMIRTTVQMTPYIVPSLISGGLASAGLIGSGGIAIGNVLSNTALYATVFTNSMAQAVSEGATRQQATDYAHLSALIETGTEALFGGVAFAPEGVLSKGISGLLQDSLFKTVQSGSGRLLITRAIDVFGEGAEEFLAEYLGSTAMTVYKQDERTPEQLNADAVHAFFMASIQSAIGQLGRMAIIKTADKLTQQPQIDVASIPLEQQNTVMNDIAVRANTKLDSGLAYRLETLPKGNKGYYDSVNNEIVLNKADVQENGLIASALPHEIIHPLERTSAYQELADFVIQNNEELYNVKTTELMNLYQRNFDETFNKQLEQYKKDLEAWNKDNTLPKPEMPVRQIATRESMSKEFVANFMRDNLGIRLMKDASGNILTDQNGEPITYRNYDALLRLANDKPNVITKLKGIIQKMVSNAKVNEALSVDDVKTANLLKMESYLTSLDNLLDSSLKARDVNAPITQLQTVTTMFEQQEVKDTTGKVLTPNQVKIVDGTKAVENNEVLSFDRVGSKVYIDVKNPIQFDSQNIANLINEYQKETGNVVEIKDGLFSEESAYDLLGYAQYNGYGYDGIVYNNNGKKDYIASSNEQYVAENRETKPEPVSYMLSDMQDYGIEVYRLIGNQYINAVGNLELVNVDKISTLIDEEGYDNAFSYVQNIKQQFNEMDNISVEEQSNFERYVAYINKFISEYNPALKHNSSGELTTDAQEKYFENSKAKVNGKLMTLYHGTRNVFDSFNYNLMGRTGTENGIGIYLASDPTLMQKYAKFNDENKMVFYELYANIQKPFSFIDSRFTEQELQDYVNGTINFFKDIAKKYNEDIDQDILNENIDDIIQYLNNININTIEENGVYKLSYNTDKNNRIVYNFKKKFDSTLESFIGNINFGSLRFENLDAYNELGNIYLDYLKMFIKTTGYDGFIGNDVIVAFLPEQVKRADNYNPVASSSLSDIDRQTFTVKKEFISNLDSVTFSKIGDDSYKIYALDVYGQTLFNGILNKDSLISKFGSINANRIIANTFENGNKNYLTFQNINREIKQFTPEPVAIDEYPDINIDEIINNLNTDKEVDANNNVLFSEQVNYFKDSKVRDKDGKLLVMYHGTPNKEFTVFDHQYLGKTGLMYGTGFYFTPSRFIAGQYTGSVQSGDAESGRIIEAYLDIKKPLKFGDKVITSDEIKQVILALDKYTVEHPDEFDGIRALENFGDIYGNSTTKVLNDAVSMVTKGHSDVDTVNTLLSVMGNDELVLRTIKDTIGYDGIIATSNTGDVYIPFMSEQIKDINNILPTSSPDIQNMFSSQIELTDGQKESIKEYAVEKFGVTNNFKQALFITNDGKLISGTNDNKVVVKEFVQKDGYRAIQHTDVVNEIFKNSNIDLPFNFGLYEMIKAGNIRLYPEYNSLEIGIEPNKTQYDVIEQYLNDSLNRGGDRITVSVRNENNEEYFKYEITDNPSNIINDIKKFYANGYVNQNKFRQFMLEDNKGNKLSQGQQSYFKDTKVLDNNGNLLEVYHGTNADFNVFDYLKMGNKGKAYGYGFYFTDNFNYAYEHGNKIIKSYLNIKNIINEKSNTINEKTTKILIEKFFDVVEFEFTNSKMKLPDIEQFYKNRSFSDKYDMGIIGELIQSTGIDVEKGIKIINEVTGIDGFVVDKGDKYGKIYVSFFPNQIKDVDNLNPTENNNIQFMLEDGYYPEDIKVKVSQFEKSVIETKMRGIEKIRVNQEIDKGTFNYVVSSDNDAVKFAVNNIDNIHNGNLDEALNEFTALVNSGQRLSKNEIAVGEVLIKRLSNAKRTQDVINVIQSVAILGTELGQQVQALSLIKKLTPLGQLMTLQRVVNRMKNEYAKRGILLDIKLEERLVKEINETTTQKMTDAVIEELKLGIAKQLPSTLSGKLDAWRYMSMLGNPLTHIRNVMGNAVFIPVRELRDVVTVAMEKFIAPEERTKSILTFKDKPLKEFAKTYFNQNKDELMTNGKYDIGNEIERMKRIFRSQTLESFRTFNFDMLNKEDELFVGMHYTSAFAQYMKARGLTPENITEAQINEASVFAMKDAKRLTYRDTSKLAQLLNYAERNNKFASSVLKAIVPFRQTPINIVKRGYEFSPIGLFVNTIKTFNDMANGRKTFAQSIDLLASGLTGTAITALGAWMYSLGLINVGEETDDPLKKRAYDRALGFQRYSINLEAFGGSGTYTIDWAVPAVMPLIVGAEIQKKLNTDYEESFVNYAPEALAGIFDPLLDLSMLKGITEAVKSFEQEGTLYVGDVFLNSAVSYVSQFIPTVSGQIARIADKYQRSTYAPKDSEINAFVEQTARQLANKVPFLSYLNEPVVDIKGEPVERGDNLFSRALLNMLSIGYYKERNVSNEDKEILRLYDLTKDSGVIPKVAPKSVTQDGQDYVLDNKQLNQFSTTLGKTTYSMLENLFSNKGYLRLSSEEKVKVAQNIYDYAYASAKEEFLKGENTQLIDSWYSKIKNAERAGIKPIDYLLVKAQYNIIEGDELFTKKEKFIEYLNSAGYGINLDKYLKYVGGYKVDTLQ